MKGLRLVTIIVIGAFALTMFFPTYAHRYRVTIEIETPDGVRTGSSVVEVEGNDVQWVLIAQGRYEFRVRGEAVFVDLGAGRNVVALRAHGPYAQDVDQMTSLQIEAYGHYKWDEEAWAGKKAMRGPVELKPALVPTLVTVTDPSDPRTAQVVYATDRRGRIAIDRVSELLGPDTHFKRAWIETVPVGYWPLNLLGITGKPLTRKIEAKLPGLRVNEASMRSSGLTMPQRFQPGYGHFKAD